MKERDDDESGADGWRRSFVIFRKRTGAFFMEAMIQVSETELARIREMGMEILCTEENAVYSLPLHP